VHSAEPILGAQRCLVSPGRQNSCRAAQCQAAVPPTLVQESLCLEHYLEQGQQRVHESLTICRDGRALDPRMIDWLFTGAEFAVQTLALGAPSQTAEQRERLLELLLSLTNLQEYLRHHSVTISQPE
jgi:hypothetical protein